MAATARLEVRVRPDTKARLERAAEIAQVPLSDFVRTAAEDRADAILREHQNSTTVPAEFFDDLWVALAEPPRRDPALARASRRASKLVTRD
ncbi:MAG TPA: DUF1778 domain-containing protein [Frankiaceae bacterium]|jgi:uncharacterized protein (DUF1778 family)|nr:DUF1778 domain-containing protein [Frankiaceae bacterium]